MPGIEQQRALGSRISNFQANTLKEGRAQFSRGFLRGRVDLLQDYWRRFQSGHEALLVDETLSQDEYFMNDYLGEIELAFTSALGFLYDEQSALAAPDGADMNPIREAGMPVPLQLPKVNLPPFSGLICEWESFRDMFRSMIHLHPSLTDVQKLHYLFTSVQGEARSALEGLAPTAANYHVAWNLLVERFEHKRLLVFHHMATLARAPALKVESAEGLRSLQDRVTKARESLRSLGMPVDNWETWMVFFTINGLDAATKKDWDKSVGETEDIPTFAALKTFINGRIRALQTSTTPSSDRKPPLLGNPSKRTTHSLATGSRRRCPVCEGDHALHRCTRPSTEIHAAVRRLRYCFNCLQSGHRQALCPSQNSCRDCQQRHHTILHRLFSLKRGAPDSDDHQPQKRARSIQDISADARPRDAATS